MTRATLFTVFSVIIAVPRQWLVGQDWSWGEGGSTWNPAPMSTFKVKIDKVRHDRFLFRCSGLWGEGRGIAVFWFVFQGFLRKSYVKDRLQAPRVFLKR